MIALDTHIAINKEVRKRMHKEIHKDFSKIYMRGYLDGWDDKYWGVKKFKTMKSRGMWEHYDKESNRYCPYCSAKLEKGSRWERKNKGKEFKEVIADGLKQVESLPDNSY